jgi:hypothetical protein
VSGGQTTINVNASDPSPSPGLKEVRFYWQYCPNGACQSQNLIGAAGTSPYSIVWSWGGLSCSTYPEDRFTIRARAEDNCGNVSADAVVNDIRLVGRCFRDAAVRGATRSWVSELSVPSGRGQVVVDGTQAVFPAAGTDTFSAPVGPGSHRFEATLVDGAGRPGGWRFDLSALALRPGSLRVVAGEAAQAGAATVVFRLRGRPGERVVFTFEVGGDQ